MGNQLAVIESDQFEVTQRVAKAMVASGYFKDTQQIAQAVVKIMAGQEMGIAPFAAMTGINIQGGKPTLSGNLIATLIKRHPDYDYKIAALTNQECVLVFYENGVEVGESSFTMKDAKTARVWSKKKSGFIPLTEHNQNWQSYPRNMLFNRSMSNGAKWYAAGIFGGAPVYTPDEPFETGEVIDVTPGVTIDTEREKAELSQIVDIEVDREEHITNDDSEPAPESETKPMPDHAIADLRATIEGGTDGKVTVGFIIDRATMTRLYNADKHTWNAAMLWEGWPEDNGNWSKDNLTGGSVMAADKGLALFDWLVDRKTEQA